MGRRRFIMIDAPLAFPPMIPTQRVPQVLPAFAARASGADEAYEDERRLLRRWQDRVEISREAYRLLDSERTTP